LNETPNKERTMTTATQDAISLAKAQINDGGMDDANAIDAACEQHPSADRKAVAKAIGEWS
jgi:hypothetical protein